MLLNKGRKEMRKKLHHQSDLKVTLPRSQCIVVVLSHYSGSVIKQATNIEELFSQIPKWPVLWLGECIYTGDTFLHGMIIQYLIGLHSSLDRRAEFMQPHFISTQQLAVVRLRMNSSPPLPLGGDLHCFTLFSGVAQEHKSSLNINVCPKRTLTWLARFQPIDTADCEIQANCPTCADCIP